MSENLIQQRFMKLPLLTAPWVKYDILAYKLSGLLCGDATDKSG